MAVTVGFSLRQFSDIFKIRDADGQPYILIGGQAVNLKILLPCVRAFLGELLQQVELGQLPARDWLKVANQVLKLTTNHRARKIASKHQLNWPDMLPLSAIAKSQHEKIRRFQEQQLEQGYKTSKGISI